MYYMQSCSTAVQKCCTIKRTIYNKMSNVKFGIALGSSVSLNSPYLLGGSILQAMDEAAKLHYDGIELHLKDLEEIDIRAVEEYQKTRDMEISAISTGAICYQGKLFLNDPEDQKREKAIEEVRKYIKVASRLKCSLIFANIRGRIPVNRSMEESEAIYADSLKVLSEDAEKHGVFMLLELTNRYEANYLNNVLQGVRFLKKYKIPMTRLHLDTFHMNIEESCTEDAIREAGDYLGYFHIADNNRYSMGSGQISFQRIFKALKAIGYRGYITAECIPYPNGTVAAEKTIKLMNAMAESCDL